MKNIAALSVGAVLSRGIAVISTPIISRIYGPEVFGDFAVLSSNYKIIETLAMLGMLMVIMVAESDEEAKGTCRLILQAVIAVSSLCLILLILLKDRYRLFELSIDYATGCICIFLLVICDTFLKVTYAYANRMKEYKVILYAPIVNSVGTVGFSVLFGCRGLKTDGYASAVILATLFEALYILYFVNPFRGKIEVEYSLKNLLKRNRIYPAVQLPANIVDTLNTQLPVKIINFLFGSLLLGSYVMCQKVFLLFVNLVAMPFNRVYMQEASEKRSHGEDIGELSFHILKSCAKLVIGPILVIILFGRTLLPLVLGSKWQEAGLIISAAAVVGLVEIIDNCLANRFVIIGRHRMSLLFSGIELIISALALYIGSRLFGDLYQTLMVYALCKSAVTLTGIGIYLKKVGIQVKRYLRFVFAYFVFPTVFIMVLKGIERL